MSKTLELNTSLLSESFLAGPAVMPGEIVLGVLSAIDADGNPLVAYLQSGYSRRVAVSSLPVSSDHIGRQVALLFVNGDLQRPIIIGFVRGGFGGVLDDCALTPADKSDDSAASSAKPQTDVASNVVRVDGKRVVLEGQDEIVLQCGEASITLTRAGKIEIRGKYLVSRSTGVNRILGASVNVN